MSTLLVNNIHTLATMDAERREFTDAAIFVRDNVIEAVGKLEDMPDEEPDEILDLSNHVVIPGLINTHHHMYQTLTRCLALDDELFGWLKTLYPIWRGLTGEGVYVSAKLAMTELILSGCTTASDHLYIYPNDSTLDDEIRAAQEVGLRFHAARGSMSVGESKGGLPPDDVVEDEDAILIDSQRLIEQYHDADRYAMLRVVLAPCSPFSVSRDLMRESAAMAREYGVRLHTHLAENENDIIYSREQFNMRPGEYAEDVHWTGDDVWHAHCVKLNDEEINLFARTGTGVCHCPTSNMRVASGIAPIRKMRDAGVRVGLGVDGSASNDLNNLLLEARQAMLLQRVLENPKAMPVREALEIATLGSASVLGRDDVGAIAPGMAADFVAYKLDHIAFAGAMHDPIAALLLCFPPQVNYSIINGKMIVREGVMQTADVPVLFEQHDAISRKMVNGETV